MVMLSRCPTQRRPSSSILQYVSAKDVQGKTFWLVGHHLEGSGHFPNDEHDKRKQPYETFPMCLKSSPLPKKYGY